MTWTIKSAAAVLAAISVFVMPSAAMPLHCMLMAPPGGNLTCHMMGMDSSTSGEHVILASFDHSCCQVSADKPESMTGPSAPSDKGTVVVATATTLLTDIPGPGLRELLAWTDPQPGGPARAVLCTFII